MVPKSGSEFETSLRSTTNFLKKNKKSVGGMKKTSKKISVSESNEKIEIDNFQQGGQRKKEIQIFGINFVCKVLHFLNFRTRSKRRNKKRRMKMSFRLQEGTHMSIFLLVHGFFERIFTTHTNCKGR